MNWFPDARDTHSSIFRFLEYLLAAVDKNVHLQLMGTEHNLDEGNWSGFRSPMHMCGYLS